MTALIALVLTFYVGVVVAEDVTCESNSHKRQECSMDTSGNVRLKQQLSRAVCAEGVSWGLSTHTVWVENGCRGVFEDGSTNVRGYSDRPSNGGIPLVNAMCPNNIDVHADRGGPIYIDGRESQLKRYNHNYYEAKDAVSGVTVSLSLNPDGTPSVSYTGKGRANGECRIRQ